MKRDFQMVNMLEREIDHHLADMMVEHLAVMLGQSPDIRPKSSPHCCRRI